MTIQSFFKNLFGKKREDENPDDDEAWSEKRQSERISLHFQEKLFLHLLTSDEENQAHTVIAKVLNVSNRGCRVYVESPDDMKKVNIGGAMVSSIVIEGFSIPLSVTVIRPVGKNQLAIRFNPPYPRELRRLEKFLEPRLLGRSVREIDPSAIKEGEGNKMRWFSGVNDTSLFCWMDSNHEQIIHQQLVFLEHVVEWKDQGKIKTGKIRSDAGVDNPYGYVKSAILDIDADTDRVVLEQARVLVDSMKVDEKVKEEFLKRVEEI